MKKLLGIVVLGLLWCNIVYALPKCKGEDYSKWTSCVGTYTNDKHKYTGEFGNDPGKRHGKGISVNKKGYKFEGIFKNDRIYRGTLTTPKIDIVYRGQFKNDKFHGYGTLLFNDLDIEYVGQFKDGKQHGKGREVDKKYKIIYVGDFKDGKYDGTGTIRFLDSKVKYVGQWENHMWHGQGKLLSPKEKKWYVGEFKEGKAHGYGTMVLNRKVYKGIWENDKFIKAQ